MHPSNVPNSGPKVKLIEAAEKLFAENGFDVVSVRDITQAAKGNVAAVNYHFGSRDGLVGVVISRYITPINEARMARLDALEAEWLGRPVPPRQILAAMLMPLVERMEESPMSERLYCKLVGRIFSLEAQLPKDIEQQLGVLMGRLKLMLGKSLPKLSVEEIVWRLHFVVGGMLHTLVHREGLERIAQEAAGHPTLGQTVERFLDFAVAGLSLAGTEAVEPPVLVRVAEPRAMRGEVAADAEDAEVAAETERVVEGGIAGEGAAVGEAGGEEVAAFEVSEAAEVTAGAEINGHSAAAEVVDAELEARPAKKRAKRVEVDTPQGFFSF